ncbi:galactoside alpha-(1,2)-fucosyltransferase 2-like [Penaeus japonicus]|uniref:galactoside alpha-(1,2)-fucosyltransferase 2-like n=2 Tax=Penaeus japonicus TaxID=27405 RepID=UPI001C71732D|nr:galactoside alpha-(1,2)-fucosyltransferase 2-like [Penaeus japonicus]
MKIYIKKMETWYWWCRLRSRACGGDFWTRGSQSGGSSGTSAAPSSCRPRASPRACLLLLAVLGVLCYGLLDTPSLQPAVPWRRWFQALEGVNETVLELLTQDKDAASYLPPTVVPPTRWVRYNQKWNGYQLPVITCQPLGRFGNVMGEYATLWALKRMYNVSVVVTPAMNSQLNSTFPTISLPRHPGPFKRDQWRAVGKVGDLYNYALVEVAATGLLGPRLFVMTDYAFEIQLFKPYKEELRREFTFADQIQSDVRHYLQDILTKRDVIGDNDTSSSPVKRPPVLVGFHIRRTDYEKHAKKMFGATLPGEKYFQRALDYYRKKFSNNVLFVAASDDMDFIHSKLKGEIDVFFAPGTSAAFDMALLSSCNHSIITMGSYGFWTGYLAGGEVVYPDVKLYSDYRFSRSMYERVRLDNFTPLPVD